MKLDLRGCIKRLAVERPVFHSEADFQHALAWAIQNRFPAAAVRLELRPNVQIREYMDIWVTFEGERHAIELKYKTRQLGTTVNGEAFSLVNQAAQDLARYDFFKDVERLERLVSSGAASFGWAVFLTNDRGYWMMGRDLSVDAAFRMQHGRSATGTMAWMPHASSGTIKNRDRDLLISGVYVLDWADYAKLGPGLAETFRILVLEVAPVRSPPQETS